MVNSVLSLILLDLPLDTEEYTNVFYGMVFVCIFTLLFIIVYLMIGEEREERET